MRKKGLVRLKSGVAAWFSTTSGALLRDEVSSVAVDRTHNVWAGTLGGGLVRINAGIVKSPERLNTGACVGPLCWDLYTSASSALTSDNVTTVLFKDFRIWCGTWGGGMVKLPGCDPFDLQKYPPREVFIRENSQMPDDRINCMASAKNGNIWIGTENGLARKCNDALSVWNTGNSKIPGNYIRDIAINALDDIAIATDNNGLAIKIKRDGWAVLNTTNGFPCNRVRALAYDDKKFAWFAATDKGLARVTVPVTRGGFGELGLP
jgi:ligand-binding sensor domain-containing protein